MGRSLQEIAAEVLEDINDPDGVSTPKATVVRYLAEGQKRFVTRTKTLRGRAPITIKENQQVYTLPIDCLMPLRIENEDGEAITPTTSVWLQKTVGNAWRSRTNTGDPQYWYSDAAGAGKFEFYPRPSPSIEVGPVTFVGTLVPRINISGVLGLARNNDILYILDSNNIFKYRQNDRYYDLLRTITHSLALTVDPANVNYNHIVVANPSITNVISPETFFVFSAGAATVIKKITATGTVSTFGTAGASIERFLDLDKQTAGTLIWQTTANDLYKTVTSSFSEVLLDGTKTTAILGHGIYYLNSSGTITPWWYIAGGADGLYKTDGTTVTAVASGTVFDVAIDSDNDTGYFLESTSGEIKQVDLTDDTVTTLVSGLNINNSDEKLYFSNDYLFWFQSDPTNYVPGSVIVYTDAGDLVGEFPASNINASYQYQVYVAVKSVSERTNTKAPREKKAPNDLFLVFDDNEDQSLYVPDSDAGCVVRIDSEKFDSDYGVVVDIIEDTDTIFIASDYGVVTSLVVDDDQYQVLYVRKPSETHCEIEDERVLSEYAKYKIKARSSNAQALQEATMHFAEYDDLETYEIKKVMGGRNNVIASIPSYY